MVQVIHAVLTKHENNLVIVKTEKKSQSECKSRYACLVNYILLFEVVWESLQGLNNYGINRIVVYNCIESKKVEGKLSWLFPL